MIGRRVIDGSGGSARRRTRLVVGPGVEIDVVEPDGRAERRDVAPGGGQPTSVLLLHGIGMTSATLEPVATSLAPTHRAVCLTLPGHGGVPRPPRGLSVEDYAAVAAQAVGRLRLGRVIVVGQSMGTQVAVELARGHPDLVEGLVLIGPVVDDAHATVVAQARALAIDSSRESVRANALVVRDYLRCGLRWYLPTLRAMLAYPTLEKASALAVPTIVVRGAGDPIAGPTWAERLAAAMGDARVVTLVGPHHAQLVRPGDVAELVRRLDARWSRPRQGPARGRETGEHGTLTTHGRRSNA